jgi:hypothetical protein
MDNGYTEEEVSRMLDEAFARGYEAGIADREQAVLIDDSEETLA